jgi:hypothetical protein
MTHLDPEPTTDDLEVASFDEPRIARLRDRVGAREVAIGVGVGIVVTGLLVAASRRGHRAPTILGTVARSLVREVGMRVLLGAATAAGARIAEAAVPMVVAAISARRARRTRGPVRRTRGAET